MQDKPTKTLIGQKAQDAILRGVNAIYHPVRMTLGPSGSNALLYRTFNRGSRITNDGKTIADVIEPIDEFENLAAKAFKEATEETNKKVGDGTTSTCVIAGKLINDLMVKMASRSASIGVDTASPLSMSVIQIKNQIINDSKKVIDEVVKRAKKVETIEELEQIATISVEDAEIGKTIANILWEIGTDGFVDIMDGHKGIIETEIIKGMRFPAKPGAKGFVNNPAKFEMIASDVAVLITNYKLDNLKQVVEMINPLLKKNPKLAIFAPGYSNEVLTELWKAVYDIADNGVRVKKGNVDIFPIHTPSLVTEQYDDLATYTGATFINKETGRKLYGIYETDLGFAEKIIVKDSDNREDAAVIGGMGTKEKSIDVDGNKMISKSAVQERIETLQAQVSETKSDVQKKLLERRIASISSAVGIIRVGATSSAEGLYKKLKIEDAVYAAKAALQEGYVKGGGVCLYEIADQFPDSILHDALKAPYEQIQENNGGAMDIPDTVIDPVKVVRLSVENAVSVAGHLITAKIIVPEVREKNPAEGYEAIADAINMYNRLWNKKEALWKENEMEMKLDEMARHDSILRDDMG